MTKNPKVHKKKDCPMRKDGCSVAAGLDGAGKACYKGQCRRGFGRQSAPYVSELVLTVLTVGRTLQADQEHYGAPFFSNSRMLTHMLTVLLCIELPSGRWSASYASTTALRRTSMRTSVTELQ